MSEDQSTPPGGSPLAATTTAMLGVLTVLVEELYNSGSIDRARFTRTLEALREHRMKDDNPADTEMMNSVLDLVIDVMDRPEKRDGRK